MSQVASLPQTSGLTQTVASSGKLAEFAFGLFLVLVFVGLSPFSYGVNSLDNIEGEGNILRQVSFLAAGSLIFFCYVHVRGLRLFKPVPLSAILILGWMTLSTLWSVSPDITLRRSILTGLVALSVFWSVAVLGPGRSLSILRLVLIPVIVIDFLSVWVIPSASHPYEGQMVWAGMHGHKNLAGAIASFAGLLFLHFAVTRRSFVDWIFLACAVIFLWGTASKTAMALLILMFVFYVFYSYAQKNILRRRMLVFGFWSAMLAVAALCWAYWDEIILFLEDPAIFTGRGLIWRTMLFVIPEHLWAGVGFGAFWQGDSSPIRPYLGLSWIIGINSAHNGYMEVLATLGVIGLGLSVLAFVIAPLRHMFSFKVSKEDGGFVFAVVWFTIIGAITKGIFLDTARPEWVMFVLGLAILHGTKVRGS